MISRKGIIGLFFCAFFSLLCSSAEETVYVVQAGDTIFSLARRFEVDQNELMRFNGISDSSRIRVGQSLRIPGTGAAPAAQTAERAWTGTYRVVSGDTLYSLVRKYGVTQEALLRANNLAANYVLKIGDVLKVPGAAASGTTSTSTSGTSTATGSGSNVSNSTVVSRAVDTSVRWPINVKEMNSMAGRPGVVITGERNESVKSLTRGMVISAGPFRDYGRVVIIQVEGGYHYVYGGCETLSVQEGDRVGPGTEIGRLGIDKASGKPLLLFLVYRSDRPVDPAKAPRA